jgi:EAL and modified HD-GYP domain-containing signal transduction protein
MFSLLDAIIDQPMEIIIGRLPLSQNLGDALVRSKGPLMRYLDLAKSYEIGSWDNVQKGALSLGIPENTLPELYLKACQWSHLINK